MVVYRLPSLYTKEPLAITIFFSPLNKTCLEKPLRQTTQRIISKKQRISVNFQQQISPLVCVSLLRLSKMFSPLFTTWATWAMGKKHQPGFNEKYPAGFFERGSLVTGVARLYFFCAGIPIPKKGALQRWTSSWSAPNARCLCIGSFSCSLCRSDVKKQNPGAEEQWPRGAGYLLYIGYEILLSCI